MWVFTCSRQATLFLWLLAWIQVLLSFSVTVDRSTLLKTFCWWSWSILRISCCVHCLYKEILLVFHQSILKQIKKWPKQKSSKRKLNPPRTLWCTYVYEIYNFSFFSLESISICISMLTYMVSLKIVDWLFLHTLNC